MTMQTTVYETVKKFLEANTKARERSQKDRAIVYMLKRKYGLDTQENDSVSFPDSGSLVQFCRDYTTYDRAWRQVTEKNEYLRGNDYGEKVKLVENKLLNLGYMDIRKQS